MTIYTSNLIINGVISNFPALYTNNMSASTMSNIRVLSDMEVQGNICTYGCMDIGNTMFGYFRLNSNIPFAEFANEKNEVYAKSNLMVMDFQSSDISGMSSLPISIPLGEVYDQATGILNVPITGYYHITMQGSFSNSISNVVNGVYFKFLNEAFSNARNAVVMSPSTIISSSTLKFFLAGDKVHPTFFSTDSNAVLLSDNGETYAGFTVISTVTPMHSNYVRP